MFKFTSSLNTYGLHNDIMETCEFLLKKCV